MTTELMRAQDISRRFPGQSQPALAGMSVNLQAGEILGLVGESGCGKSTLARILVGLRAADSGTLRVCGRNLRIDGHRRSRDDQRLMQMIFQSPAASFNPKFKVGSSIRMAAKQVDLGKILGAVHLEASLAERYPHQLSGGQLQRAAIARALACEPMILIGDEPTSALDVTIRAHIMSLFVSLRQTQNLSIILITHDLSSLRGIADRIIVMRSGEFVEEGNPEDILLRPQHDYTQRLVEAIPRLPSSA